MITEKMFTDLGYERKVLDRMDTWRTDKQYSLPEKQLVSSRPGPVVAYFKGNFGLIQEAASRESERYRMSFVSLWIADLALMENICLSGLNIVMRVPCNTFVQLYLIDQLLEQWTKEALSRDLYRQGPQCASHPSSEM